MARQIARLIALGLLAAAIAGPAAAVSDPEKLKTPQTPWNALSPDERQVVIDLLHAPRFVNHAPAEVVATLLDDGTYETHAAIVTAQALHHGSAHREQICAILRDLGLDPPEVQPWDFADSTGRSRWIKPE